MLRSLQRFTIRQVWLNISLTAPNIFSHRKFSSQQRKQKKHKRNRKKTFTKLPNTKMNQEHADITALINNGLRHGAVDTKQHVQVNHRIQVLQKHVKNYTADDQRKPSFITAHIPSREKQRLGLRIEEMDMGTSQTVVVGEPHPCSEQTIGSMSKFERGERAKICPGQELLAINGGQLVPATLERAVELVAIAESPVQLTLRFPPEDSINLKRRRINH